jgi:hypothetical protein
MGHDQNSLPDLLELLARTGKASPGKSIDLCVDLRGAIAELEGPDGISFQVGLRRAWLSVEVSGLNVVPGSRYGEPTKPNDIAIKEEFSNQQATSTQGHLGGTAQLSASSRDMAGKASLDAGIKRSAKNSSVISATSSEVVHHIRVKARGNLMWEITDSPRLSTLDATYLNDCVLCRLAPVKGANAKTAALSVYAKQKDIMLKADKEGRLFSFKSTNHEKMLKILIAKAISQTGVGFNGVITFSTSEIEIED